jgi:hypothetical protein
MISQIILDLIERMNALPNAGPGSQRGRNFYVRLDDVLDVLEATEDTSDERNKAEVAATAKWCREDERATMRAKVETLWQSTPESWARETKEGYVLGYREAIREVLILIDGDVLSVRPQSSSYDQSR